MHIFLINIKTQEIQWLITMKLVKKSGINVKENLIMFLLELELEELWQESAENSKKKIKILKLLE